MTQRLSTTNRTEPPLSRNQPWNLSHPGSSLVGWLKCPPQAQVLKIIPQLMMLSYKAMVSLGNGNPLREMGSCDPMKVIPTLTSCLVSASCPTTMRIVSFTCFHCWHCQQTHCHSNTKATNTDPLHNQLQSQSILSGCPWDLPSLVPACRLCLVCLSNALEASGHAGSSIPFRWQLYVIF